MTGIFLQVLSMSITASWCILLVFLVRLLLRKAPRIYSYALWLIVAFRLVCPVSFESAFCFSLPSVVSPAASAAVHGARQIFPAGGGYETAAEALPGESAQNGKGSGPAVGRDLAADALPSPEHRPASLFLRVWQTAGCFVWLAGVGVLLLYHMISYRRLKGKLLRAAVPSSALTGEFSGGGKLPVWEAEGLETPFVFGVVRPVIYLPTKLSGQSRNFCLAHETVHLRRRDYLIKQAAFLLACIHWFNPFVWLAYDAMCRDMEMSCDEAVVRYMNMEEKKDYSGVLLSLAGSGCDSGLRAGTPTAFSENTVKKRIINIMNYKKPGFWVTALCIVIVLIVSLGLIADPKTERAEGTETAKEVVLQEQVREEESGKEQEADVAASSEGKLSSGVLSVPVSAFPAYVKEETLNVRELPFNDAQVIGMLPAGAEVEVTALPGSVWKEGVEYGLFPEDFAWPETEQEQFAGIRFVKEDGTEVRAYVQARYLEITEEVTKRERIYWAAKAWGDTFCARDGEALAAMTEDRTQMESWDLADVSADGRVRDFGWSSPWPWGQGRSYDIELSEQAGELTSSGYDVTLRYYAWTSDPTVTVWVQSIRFNDEIENKTALDSLTKQVISGFSPVDYMDDIGTGDAFDRAYQKRNGEADYFDYEGSGYTGAVAFLLGQSGADGTGEGVTDNSVYQRPDTAVVRYLHLSGGSAEIVEENGNAALVRYTFADGSFRDIPMFLAVEEPAVWAPGK